MVTVSSTADSETLFVPFREPDRVALAGRFATDAAIERVDALNESGMRPRFEPSPGSNWSTTIASLAAEHLVLRRPIPVVIEEDDGVFVASFLDANINASGDTLQDAYEALKEFIASRFRLLERHIAELGNEPMRQLTVLRDFMQQSSDG
jgi:hypothetical protein